MQPPCSSPVPSPATRPPRRVRRLVFRFWRAREGATAIEFAFVALPFFALLFAIIETALVFWTTQVLETAVADSARQIYTGQFEQLHANSSPEVRANAFREMVCGRVVALVDCRRTLQVTVREVGSFTAQFGAILDEDGNLDPAESRVEPTRTGEIVIVRAALLYPMFFMESFGAALAGVTDQPRSNGRLIGASAAFRNEPF